MSGRLPSVADQTDLIRALPNTLTPPFVDENVRIL
jgi:hypothetical protein